MMLHGCPEPHHTQMNADTHMLAAAAAAAGAAAAAAGQRVAGPSLREEEGMMGMGARREQLHVLLHHCWSMKRQETRLRLVTLLLLLTCASLYVFNFCMDLKRSNPPAGPSAPGEQSALYSSQEKGNRSPYVQLSSKHGLINSTMMWHSREESSFSYNETSGAIKVPESGIYFLYVTFQLSCHCEDSTSFQLLSVDVVSGSEGYGPSVPLMRASDGVMCPPPVIRTVFVGEQMQLSKDDCVSVQVKKGYKLIDFAKFGAYFIK